MSTDTVKLTEDDFGKAQDAQGKTRTIKRFTWTNANKVSVQVITYGGYITSIKLPDKNGKIEDITVGFDSLEGYQSPNNKFFGATVGRVANRIAKGKMTIAGVEYTLATNNGENHLHGGVKGFDKVIWEPFVEKTKLTLSYHSPDGEEGYPGDVVVNVSFQLNDDSEFKIDYWATTTKLTPINLTNHTYFNLAGSGKGAGEIYKHVISINADKITEVSNTIPTGKFINVGGTVFDFRVPKALGDVINKVPNALGFDHNFCINKGKHQLRAFVARVVHPDSGRVMEVESNQPGVQFYTGNALPEDEVSKGKGGAWIKKHGAFCLETQKYPDAVHHPHFPNVLINPGDKYHHVTVFKFFVEK